MTAGDIPPLPPPPPPPADLPAASDPIDRPAPPEDALRDPADRTSLPEATADQAADATTATDTQGVDGYVDPLDKPAPLEPELAEKAEIDSAEPEAVENATTDYGGGGPVDNASGEGDGGDGPMSAYDRFDASMDKINRENRAGAQADLERLKNAEVPDETAIERTEAEIAHISELLAEDSNAASGGAAPAELPEVVDGHAALGDVTRNLMERRTVPTEASKPAAELFPDLPDDPALHDRRNMYDRAASVDVPTRVDLPPDSELVSGVNNWYRMEHDPDGNRGVSYLWNCSACTRAVDARLAGVNSTAYAGTVQRSATVDGVGGDVIAAEWGRPPLAMDHTAVSDRLLEAGPGARGILLMKNDDAPVGHVVNVVNRDGVLVILDGQSGQTYPLASAPQKIVGFLPTYEPGGLTEHQGETPPVRPTPDTVVTMPLDLRGAAAITPVDLGTRLLKASGFDPPPASPRGRNPVFDYETPVGTPSQALGFDVAGDSVDASAVDTATRYMDLPPLDHDLWLAQYYDGAKQVGYGEDYRSYRFWRPISPAQIRSLSSPDTVEHTKEYNALMSDWGPRDHVQVARIPAGTTIRVRIDDSAPQAEGWVKEVLGDPMDPATNDLRVELQPDRILELIGGVRLGGDKEMEFGRFDERWLVGQRAL